jgi:ABC-type multidrug transport system fused ATPase/permease subunit
MPAPVQNLKTVLKFGLQYMRPYWVRLVAGVVLGIICGVMASGFLWATGTLAERLQPQPRAVETCANCGVPIQPAAPKPSRKVSLSMFPELEKNLSRWGEELNRTIDPWLPRANADLTWKAIVGCVLLLPLLALLRGATEYGSNYCMGWVSERVINDLRCDVLRKLTTLSFDYFNRSTTGDMFTRIHNDTLNLHKALRQGTADLVRELFTMISVFLVLIYLDWKLTAFALLLAPCIIGPIYLLGRKARRSSREARKAGVAQTSLLFEALTGIRVLKAFNLESRQLDRFREFSRKLIHHGMKNVQAKELVSPLVEVIGAIGVGALIVYLFWSGRSLPDLVKFITGLALFFAPIKKLAGVHIMFEQASAGVERIVELLKEKPTVLPPTQPKRLTSFEKEIRFENVSFTYGDAPVLRDISLSIPRGFRLGVVGESGSGKSTLVNLLFRFYDVTGGRVTIDGIDVRELSFEDLRGPMALVSQDVFVFRTSVADNIAAGKPDATRAEIEAAARAANAHDFIMRLPEGYDTVIGERGMTLSGGQRARLAIARAFVRNAPILVLDEATASLDSKAELELQGEIDKLEQNRTVISIAHRLSTLKKMDHIIVLADGRIVEQGKFDELLRARGLFASMAARQGFFAND